MFGTKTNLAIIEKRVGTHPTLIIQSFLLPSPAQFDTVFNQMSNIYHTKLLQAIPNARNTTEARLILIKTCINHRLYKKYNISENNHNKRFRIFNLVSRYVDVHSRGKIIISCRNMRHMIEQTTEFSDIISHIKCIII
jgi:hypothetical protein